MSSAAPAPLVVFKGNASRAPAGEIHSMPCRIDYTGPANVSNYFRPERHESGEEAVTFRGRLLNGTDVKLPEGYRLHVTREKPAQGVEGTRMFVVEGSTDSFKLWDFDREPHARNPLQKALACVKIAEVLAAPDDEE
ncbi:hypothetical protein AAVH_20755 [Aphelenchoides avenae]|nr:hypothetical protein AAVH_20755 [Aphelenchus avenae]